MHQEGVGAVDHGFHQRFHLWVGDAGDVIEGELPPLGINDADIRIIARL